MKRIPPSIKARARRVWMPLIECVFTGKKPDDRVLAEAQLIEKQLQQRDQIILHCNEQSAVSMPLFEGGSNA